MTTSVESVKKLQDIPMTEVPHGKYQGSWSAYFISIHIGQELYELRTSDGVSGWNIPCNVIVNASGIFVETI